jgi:hypothetical protein
MASLVHTEEVTGSIPASPTLCFCWSDGLSMIFIGGPSVILGAMWEHGLLTTCPDPKRSCRFWLHSVNGTRILVLARFP